MASLTWVTLLCLSFLKQARNSWSSRASSTLLCSLAEESCPTASPESVLTPQYVVTHEHDLVQKLLVAEAPTGQTGICCLSDRYEAACRSDRYEASAAYTKNLLPVRDPIGAGVSWIDLAPAGQLDPPPSCQDEWRQEIRVWKRELGFKNKM
jgi:hypothetical protein